MGQGFIFQQLVAIVKRLVNQSVGAFWLTHLPTAVPDPLNQGTGSLTRGPSRCAAPACLQEWTREDLQHLGRLSYLDRSIHQLSQEHAPHSHS